jgi:hypothetical protein
MAGIQRKKFFNSGSWIVYAIDFRDFDEFVKVSYNVR